MGEQNQPENQDKKWYWLVILKVVFSLFAVVGYFCLLYFSNAWKWLENNSLLTLANGTLTVGFILAMLKTWVVKPPDKSWFETSKEVLGFWQTVLVVTVFLLFIYHLHVKNLIDNLIPHPIVFSGKVVENPSGNPIPNCTATIKFLGERVQVEKCVSNDTGGFEKIFYVSKEALENEVVITLSHTQYQEDKPFIERSADKVTLKMKERYLVKK